MVRAQVGPLKRDNSLFLFRAISSAGLEHYLDKVGVTGSNPVLPTSFLSYFNLIPVNSPEQMTAPQLNIQDFLTQSQNQLIIDVRSPVEFKKGHITGAINIPLFEDAERAEIGTLYKRQGKDTAVTRGLEIVSPKMVSFVSQAKELSKNNSAFVYCFRGGMRSNSFSWLLNTSGMKTSILKGGYKIYRRHVLSFFEIEKKLILLGGKTGSGKTEVLSYLQAHHLYQTVDIEKIAHHKGSAFGAIHEQIQNPQQIFENELFHTFSNLNSSQFTLLENESQNIGFNRIPYELWQQMRQAPVIRLEIPFDLRIQKLLKDYTTSDIDLLKQAIQKISQQLGPQVTQQCLKLLNENRLEDVAVLSLQYYDKAYEFSRKKHLQKEIMITSETIDAGENAEKVLNILNQLNEYVG